MVSFNILTQGEKIKNIRENFNIKQEELAGGEITRNLISIIENNKANITDSTAKILAKNINTICKERNLNFEVTKEYLLESVVSQAKKVATEYIEFIDNVPIEEVNSDLLAQIDVFLKTYDTEEKRALLYMSIGLKFRQNNQYVKCMDYFLKAYESSKDLEVTTKALTMLTSCNIYLGKYDDAINYCKILLDLNNREQVQYITKYNLALCYKKLNKFNEALEILHSLTEDYSYISNNSPEKYISLKLLIGSCLNNLKSFNKAITLYKDLLKEIPDNLVKEKICILSNLADVYRDINDVVKLDKICSKMLNELDKNNNILEEYESYIYLSLAQNIIFVNNDTNVATNLLLKALNNFKTRKCSLYVEDIEKLISDLLNIFITNNDEDNIFFLKNEMFELIESRLLPRANLSSLKFIKYYSFKDNKQEVNNIIDYLVS